MTVSIALAGGGSIVAWQTLGGISFQQFDADLQPVGAPTLIASGTTDWLSATALGGGGFEIVWDASATSSPVAQDYDANGVAIGAAYVLTSPPPIAAIAFTSRATDPSGTGPWTTLLPDGDTVTVTNSNGTSGPPPSLTMQQFDPADDPVGPAYIHSIAGLPGLGHVETAALANGGYAVSFVDESNYGAQSFVDLFSADGTHLASDQVGTTGYELIPAQSIAGLADGGFVVSWVAAEYATNPGTAAPYAVFSQEYDTAGSTVGAQQTLAVLPGSSTATPQIDAFADGHYTISWTAAGAIQSASFTEQGAPIASDTSDQVATAAVDYTLPVGPHDLTLIGASAQTVTGNDLGDTITSNDYGSTITGGTGNDTLIAGHEADMLTGGGGHDTFVFNFVPWSAGHITDFTPGTDTIDLSAIFSAEGYAGTNPIADGWLILQSDGAGNTQVEVNAHDASFPYPYMITTLDHVAPTSLSLADFGYGTTSGAGSGGGTGGGTGATGSSTGGGGGTGASGSGQTIADAQPTYTVPDGVTNVVLTGTGPQTVHANNLGDTITSNDCGSTIVGGTGNDTLIAGHNVDMLTGGGGNDSFVFNFVPWSAGHVTDFNTATDTLNLTGIFNQYGYAGTNPVADGWLTFQPDGAGDTRIYVNAHDPTFPYPYLITTLDHVSPSALHSGNYVFA